MNVERGPALHLNLKFEPLEGKAEIKMWDESRYEE
jgi:hypothetical protein